MREPLLKSTKTKDQNNFLSHSPGTTAVSALLTLEQSVIVYDLCCFPSVTFLSFLSISFRLLLLHLILHHHLLYLTLYHHLLHPSLSILFSNPFLTISFSNPFLTILFSTPFLTTPFSTFIRFEERSKEFERARVIYKFALENTAKEENVRELNKEYIAFEKRHGNR